MLAHISCCSLSLFNLFFIGSNVKFNDSHGTVLGLLAFRVQWSHAHIWSKSIFYSELGGSNGKGTGSDGRSERHGSAGLFFLFLLGESLDGEGDKSNNCIIGSDLSASNNTVFQFIAVGNSCSDCSISCSSSSISSSM
jgi:hypothetical protein